MSVAKFIDLTGQRFGRLTVVSRAPRKTQADGQTKTMWNCACDCGRSITTQSHCLRSGMTKSCGCLKSDIATARMTKHGGSAEPEFFIWAKMKDRCAGLREPNYGGRGIKVCERWRDSYPAFIEDMGRRPTPKHTIERLDVNGDYEPGNCSWVTRKVQARNTRRNRMITFRGETKCLVEWSEVTGLPYAALKARLTRHGWPVERALTEPLQSRP